MHICVIIPAHNEAGHLSKCIDSFIDQTHRPDELILVDDNSTDETFKIVKDYSNDHEWIKAVQHKSSPDHIPGSKVIDAFYFGLQHTSEHDLIGKFDADIILPKNYFEMMLNHFQSDWKLGMCSGLLYIQKEGKWIYENIADKNHIRGPIKLYHKACFSKIGGLKNGIGWDTVDILLAQYHNFHVKTDSSMIVKHLRPTGHGYASKSLSKKGEALYKMRYGIFLAKLTALKMAWHAKNPLLYLQVMIGYVQASFSRPTLFVNSQEGKFIRKLRWQKIRMKLF